MTEHYVTCFDHHFLLQGLALQESLQRQQPDSFLWVIALDETVERQLAQLRLSQMAVLPLWALETPELLAAKRNRSRSEYIFTLTPFTFDFVFARDSTVSRVTYVDADVFFFRNPRLLLDELDAAAGEILITPHGFPPEHAAMAEEFGRFCVQFLTMGRGPRSIAVRRRWQEQCLASCTTALAERGKVYGDQKYLDDWPDLYGELVRVASQPAEMLGPWNVDHYQSLAGDEHEPVLYHFHSLRIFHPRWIQLCCGYNPAAAARIYARYLETLDGIDGRLAQRGIGRSCVPFAGDRWWLPRLGWRLATGRATVRHWPRRPIAAADAAQEFPPWESSPDSASNCPP
jgi:hypothetical protein